VKELLRGVDAMMAGGMGIGGWFSHFLFFLFSLLFVFHHDEMTPSRYRVQAGQIPTGDDEEGRDSVSTQQPRRKDGSWEFGSMGQGGGTS